ncbi:hypothetical protein ACGO3R_03610 [Lactococcus lactis]
MVSDLGFGENKKGYGSSASVVCGLVNAVNQFFDFQLSLEKRFEIAAKTHFEVQGSGSMGDIAAIMYGGSVFIKIISESYLSKFLGQLMWFKQEKRQKRVKNKNKAF